MALREQAKRIVREREGYRIVRISRHDWRTTYIVSHKGRAVGAFVESIGGGGPEPAGSILEVKAWWEADRGAEVLAREFSAPY